MKYEKTAEAVVVSLRKMGSNGYWLNSWQAEREVGKVLESVYNAGVEEGRRLRDSGRSISTQSTEVSHAARDGVQDKGHEAAKSP